MVGTTGQIGVRAPDLHTAVEHEERPLQQRGVARAGAIVDAGHVDDGEDNPASQKRPAELLPLLLHASSRVRCAAAPLVGQRVRLDPLAQRGRLGLERQGLEVGRGLDGLLGEVDRRPRRCRAGPGRDSSSSKQDSMVRASIPRRLRPCMSCLPSLLG